MSRYPSHTPGLRYVRAEVLKWIEYMYKEILSILFETWRVLFYLEILALRYFRMK